MCFFLRDGWCVQFLKPDLKTPLPRKLRFQDAAKILEMFERFGEQKTLADRQALEHAIEIGRGGIYLTLTQEQYRKLERS